MTLRAATIGVLVLAAVGCSGGAASTEPTVAASGAAVATTEVATTTPATSAAATTSAPATVASTTELASTSSVGPDTIATVPDDGVPGIDSENAFCRAWGEFAGSFQALVLVSSVSTDPVEAARLEVVASPAVVSAARSLDDALPESVAGERVAFVDGVIGPFSLRAQRATEALAAAGLSSAEVTELGELWLDTLAAAGVDDPEIAVVVPPGLVGEVDAAVAEFVAAVPAIGDDPSLVTAATAPSTFGYLADNCPDQGILGGNDAID
jgi:hypothetical protein